MLKDRITYKWYDSVKELLDTCTVPTPIILVKEYKYQLENDLFIVRLVITKEGFA